MSYTAKVYQIMIASPGDVPEERAIIRECVHRWNDVNAASRKMMLQAVGWETHAVPETGQHPQESINKRLLRNCDLLVALFWNRIGTPTDNAVSGTVEEINEHKAAGKPVMLYFSNAPVPRNQLDQAQLAAVEAYKEQSKPDTLFETYDDVNDFRQKFERQLASLLNSEPFLAQPDLPAVILYPSPAEPSLSDDARELLTVACAGKTNLIKRISVGLVHRISADGREFTRGAKEPREFARWDGALEELVEQGLARDKGYKRQVYEVTPKGYKVNERLLSKAMSQVPTGS